MITNFEEITAPLTHDEKMIIKNIAEILEFKTKKNPIKADGLVSLIRSQTFLKRKFASARLRKMINFMRSNGMLPIIATSKGYYLSYSYKEVELEIKSLKERASAINNAADGMQKFLVEHLQIEMIL